MQIKRKITAGIAALLLFPTVAAIADTVHFQQSYGGAESTETWQLHYSGYGWVNPCVVVRNKNAVAVTVKYSRAGQVLSQSTSSGPNGCSQARTETITAWDSLNPWAPKTKFNYKFVWGAPGGGALSHGDDRGKR